MKVLIGGDFVLSETYDVSKIDDSIHALFQESDFNIVNLEAPVTDSVSKIKKTGPHLKADDSSTAEILRYLEVNLVTLANNHVLDYDEKGVADTLAFCEANSFQTVGAGMNLDEASKIKYVKGDAGVISIVNFTENEWSIATTSSAGANPMDIIDNAAQIKEAQMNSDTVIVIVHGGNEHNPYPSPRMVKQYRFYADCGANIVIGHHTHCIGGFEEYGKVPIFYSLGNLLFTMRRQNPETWYTGLIASIDIQLGNEVTFELIPIRQSKDDYKLYCLKEGERDKVLNEIYHINSVISNPMLLKTKWDEFVEKNLSSFSRSLSPIGGIKNRYIKALLYKTNFYKIFLHEQYVKEFVNRVRCEAHHDVAKDVFKRYLNK